MRRVELHHVDIVVTSLERSLPIYRELLEPLGYTGADTATAVYRSKLHLRSGRTYRGTTPRFSTIRIKLEVVFVP